jgi:SHS2 domain-containing protein
VPGSVARLELEGNVLGATVAGHRGEPPHLVKAVTYHRLEFEPGGEGWRARVVLDV